MPPKQKYTDPKLRDEIKEEVQQGDKGGAPGQWSARKAQMMASEYKKRGGDYNTDKSEKDESQQNLSNWTEEEWQTKEGSGHAKKEDGTQKRYLPKKAWEKMSKEEKDETERKKQEGSKKGKQFVGNTEKAKDSRKKATKAGQGKDGSEGEDDDVEDDDEEEGDDDEPADDDEEADDGQDQEEDDEDDDEPEAKAKSGQKRKAPQKGEQESKKQKSTSASKPKSGGNAPKGTVGSKHMPDKEPGQRGSADRLPKKGQAITWKAMPGYVEGKVVEVLKKGKTVDGKSVKASSDDPKIVMKSNSSGKTCVHKPDACFYD